MRAADIVAAVKISEVWRELGGGELRRGRGRAFWRGGDGWSVALDDAKGVFIDHARGEGGGVLYLVTLVRGGSREDALKWVSELAGLALEDSLQPDDPERAEDWARERTAYARDLAEARYWRRPAINLIEDDLEDEKAKLFDTSRGEADCLLISAWESLLRRVRDGGELTLVTEYRAWREAKPDLSAALVKWARDREVCEIRALIEWANQMDSEASH